jgi:membrane-associated protein
MGVDSIIQTLGYVGIFICVFIECGVILGLVLPLPGFSLLFAAGVFAATGHLDLFAVLLTGFAGSILGYVFGYLTGRRYGRKLFFEKNTKYFTAEQGRKAEKFMHKYGYSTLIIGRFIPFIHTIPPHLSGLAKMNFVKFMIINVIGGVLWTLSAVLLGYYLGQALPHAQFIALPFVIGLLFIGNTKMVRSWLRKLSEKIEEL